MYKIANLEIRVQFSFQLIPYHLLERTINCTEDEFEILR